MKNIVFGNIFNYYDAVWVVLAPLILITILVVAVISIRYWIKRFKGRKFSDHKQ